MFILLIFQGLKYTSTDPLSLDVKSMASLRKDKSSVEMCYLSLVLISKHFFLTILLIAFSVDHTKAPSSWVLYSSLGSCCRKRASLQRDFPSIVSQVPGNLCCANFLIFSQHLGVYIIPSWSLLLRLSTLILQLICTHVQTLLRKTYSWSCFWIKDPTMLLLGVI